MLLFYSILYLAKSLLHYKCKVTRHPQQSQRGEEQCNAVALSCHVFIFNNMFQFVFNLNSLISWSMFFVHPLTILYCSVRKKFRNLSILQFDFIVFCIYSCLKRLDNFLFLVKRKEFLSQKGTFSCRTKIFTSRKIPNNVFFFHRKTISVIASHK